DVYNDKGAAPGLPFSHLPIIPSSHDPMLRRYFYSGLIESDALTLSDAEAHHLLHVVRVQPGDEIVVFDGQGHECVAEIADCRRNEIEVRVGPVRQVDRELGFTLAVGMPLPKGDRSRWLVEKMTELGVTSFTPLHAARSQRLRGGDADKLERYVIEASKQCGRNRLMAVSPPSSWEAWVEAADADCRLLAHPGGEPLRAIDSAGPASLQLAFGPEGGLTDDEVDAAVDAGWQSVDLGPRILRMETAAVSLAAAVILARS
ncbi:RsmE family RNA methyltransferase, partial [Pirellulales bacterium]|nr:RsmE family RNA methyltransferase [Pirellulales bacterium]